MSKGDKVSLPDRMRAAAKVLREVDKRTLVKWGADIPRDLEELADMLEAEDPAAAEREAMVEELAERLCDANYDVAAWSMTTPVVHANHLSMARALIQDGWKKVTDE